MTKVSFRIVNERIVRVLRGRQRWKLWRQFYETNCKTKDAETIEGEQKIKSCRAANINYCANHLAAPQLSDTTAKRSEIGLWPLRISVQYTISFSCMIVLPELLSSDRNEADETIQ